MFNSNVWRNLDPFRYIRLLSDLDCHLSRLLKIKNDGAIELPI